MSTPTRLVLLLCCLLSGCTSPTSVEKPKTPAQETSTPIATSATPSKATRYRPDDIEILWIILKIEKKDSLFILLDRDGSVNRQGTGIEGEEQSALYIGKHSGIFEPVVAYLDEEFLRNMGGYKSNDIKGKVCELQVNFEFSDGTTNGFAWKYGLESQGPPNELRDLVVKAIELTDPIYAEILQKQTEGSKPSK